MKTIKKLTSFISAVAFATVITMVIPTQSQAHGSQDHKDTHGSHNHKDSHGSQAHKDSHDSQCHKDSHGSQVHEDSHVSQNHKESHGSHAHKDSHDSQCHKDSHGSQAHEDTHGSHNHKESHGSYAHKDSHGSKGSPDEKGSTCTTTPDEEPGSCNLCDGKLTTLTLQYNGTDDAVVQVTDKKGLVIFEKTVIPNESFTLQGFDNQGTLGTMLYISVNEDAHTSIHVSCSVPILIGMSYGDFTIIDAYSRNGGKLCTVLGYEVPTPDEPTPDEPTPDVPTPEVGNACGTVYDDLNKNDLQEPNEKGVAGLSVQLIDANGDIHLKNTVVKGNYCFYNIVTGLATVEVLTLPAGAFFSAGDNPNDMTILANENNLAGKDAYQRDSTSGSGVVTAP